MVTPLAHIRCGQEDTVAAESADEDAAPALADAGRTGLPAAAPSASVAAAHESFRDRIRCVIRHPCHRAAWARVFSCPHGARSSLRHAGCSPGGSGSCAPAAGWVGVVRGPWGAVLRYCSAGAGAGGSPPARRGANGQTKQPASSRNFRAVAAASGYRLCLCCAVPCRMTVSWPLNCVRRLLTLRQTIIAYK